MLERVALHQTRLRVPGVGLDSRGIVLGARGLVLLPSLDRLVAFLAVYTEGQSLDPIVGTLRIELVRSKLGAREIALSFDAGSSDRMDRVAEVARLAGGFTFTGTSRHFVQYRDSAAPFGYDATEITASDSPLMLYHTSFSQLYGIEQKVELRELLLRLMPHAEPRAGSDASPLWILTEQGLGTTLLHYLSRSTVEAKCGIAEWPPETSFDDLPRRRWIFRVPALPARMRPTLMATPGMKLFWPASPGALVELGYRHPISLRAVPVFDDRALVLFRGDGPPLVIDPLPALADLLALERADVTAEASIEPGRGQSGVPEVRLKLRLVPTLQAANTISATLVPPSELGMLRRLCYALGAEAIRTTRIALSERGAFLLRERGVEMLPLGTFYRRLHAAIYVPSGFEIAPAVQSETLFAALGAPQGKLLFFSREGRVFALDESAFVPLERALLEPESWAPLATTSFGEEPAAEVPTLWLEPLGLWPLKRAEPAG